MIVIDADTVIFYFLAAGSVALSVMVVSARQMIWAAIALMGVLSLSAGLYVMLHAEFLAGVQVLVYVGGIVVLIVFAVMLTRTSALLEHRPSLHRVIFAAAVCTAFFALNAGALATSTFAVHPASIEPKNEVLAIGRSLLDYGAQGYVLPFEIISLLLLAAVLGGIVIARKTTMPGQPLTSGGDHSGEDAHEAPLRQGTTRGNP